jgi:hypothetical protein
MAVNIKVNALGNVIPFSLVDRDQIYLEACCLHLHDNLELNTACSSKMLVPIYQTKWRYVSENYVFNSKTLKKVTIRYKALNCLAVTISEVFPH